MHRKWFVLILIFGLLFMAHAVSAGEKDVWDELEVRNLEGEEELFSDFIEEEYVLLEVWATWCAFCVEALDDYRENKEALEEEDIKVIALSVDDQASIIEDFKEERDIPFTVLQDYYF